MRFNIKDVAKRAGVSISTVSRVVNDSKAVRPKTKAKVLKAIEELEYKPNAIARSLKVKHTETIGIMIPDISNKFFPEVVRGVEDVANMYEYTIFLCNTDMDRKKMMQYFNVLEEKQVDGMIFMGNSIPEELARGFTNSPTPIVLIGIDYGDLPSVVIDNIQASQDMVSYLIEKGHRQIGLISANDENPIIGTARRKGYLKALKEAGIELREELMVDGHPYYRTGYEGVKKLLELDNKPTAIFATSDEMAIGGLRAALENNIAVPDDVAIVGFDNIDITGKIFPSLTTIAQPKYEMGAIAMRILTKILKKENLEDKKMILNYNLVERESS